MLAWILVVLACLVGLFLALAGDPERMQQLAGDNLPYIVVTVTLALVYLVSLSADYRGRAVDALRHAGIWIVLAAGIVTAYAYRAELTTVATRVAGEVLPPGEAIGVTDPATGERSVRLRKAANGHFAARAFVNGTSLMLLVDTGASTIVLKSTDAERIGIDIAGLSFTVPVGTANGTTYAAPVRLKAVVIGPIEQRDVEALVAKPGNLSESLLGMSFLKRLRSYEFSGDFLTLRG